MNLRQQIEQKISDKVNHKIHLNAASDLKDIIARGKKIESGGDSITKKIDSSYKSLEKAVNTAESSAVGLRTLGAELDDLKNISYRYEQDSQDWFIKYSTLAEDLGLDFTDSDTFKDMRKALGEMNEKWGEDGIGWDGFEKVTYAESVIKAIDGISF